MLYHFLAFLLSSFLFFFLSRYCGFVSVRPFLNIMAFRYLANPEKISYHVLSLSQKSGFNSQFTENFSFSPNCSYYQFHRVAHTESETLRVRVLTHTLFSSETFAALPLHFFDCFSISILEGNIRRYLITH